MASNFITRAFRCPSQPNWYPHHPRYKSSYPTPSSTSFAHSAQKTMDPLVYEDSPLATYFEGEAVPYELPHEITPPHTPFAPRGLPHFKDRLKTIRQSGVAIKPASTEQLIERFRYIIVASQLLSDDAGARPAAIDGEPSRLDSISLKGAVLTAALSFLAAWGLHWLRTRRRALKNVTWLDVGLYSIGILLMSAVATMLAKRQYVRHVQKTSIQTLSRLVDESHSLDSIASRTIRFIQEVEVVARGYDLTTPLPPVSRLEDRQAIRRCHTLRSELADTLKLLTILFVESHNAVQPFISDIDLQRYHDIYEISLVEYSQAVELANEAKDDVQHSLKELRFSLRLLDLARKVFLCDLLALRQSTGMTQLRQWNNVLRILREIEAETLTRHKSLAESLSLEEWGPRPKKSNRNSSSELSQADSEASVSANQTLKSQTRRFEEVANAIRALNAKVHITKEELDGLTMANADDCVLSSSMQRHYESLGTDIRNLIIEWEKGRNTMLLNIDADRDNNTQYSCPSSSIRSPISPSPSIGNSLTIIDGGPAEALRLLNGDFDPHTSLTPVRKSLGMDLPDEEIFEAMSKPYSRSAKRMSVSGMSREEKIAKLQEDRRKRATLQEQADNTTNMLRELRMVIKHRPRQNTASSAGAAPVPPMSPTLDVGEQRNQYQQRVTSI